jgi:predicted RNase H-like HicB family nuclease
MVNIQITKAQNNCATIYWAELTGFLPEDAPRLMGRGHSPEEAMRDLKCGVKQWIEQLVHDAEGLTHKEI